MKLENKLFHGAAYYPECWSKDNVEQDIKNMKYLGINVVRIGEFCWCELEPEEDKFNIGIFDDVISLLAKNDIKVIMCTPTATPPRWFTKKYEDSLYVNRYMVKSNHGSREHVCLNSPDYQRRTRIIVEELAKHYGNNPNIIAWQLHNEYNCPPVSECYCDNCQNAFRLWLKERYKTIENLNKEWGTTVWSTKYNSFDDVIAPRPTPNGHSASMVACYTMFTYDSVAKYNRMQADILHKYTRVPITHNTNKAFTLDQETIFESLDFVSFDDYVNQDKYVELCFDTEMNRCLKPGIPFYEMETSTITSAHLMGGWPCHKPGFVNAEAVNTFFAGGQGFSYWLFRQHRTGTEMPHGHLVNSFGTLSSTCSNVLEVTDTIKKITPFITSTKVKQAEVALLYSDKGRAFTNYETFGRNDYFTDMLTTYEALLNTNMYRDIIYEHSSFDGYKVIIIPFVMHMSDELIAKAVKAANDGATVIVGPYSGWRTASHAYYEDKAFGKLEQYFGTEIIDWDHTFGLDSTYEAFNHKDKLECFCSVVNEGIGKIEGGYLSGKSLIHENKIGKGKLVFVGTKFTLNFQQNMYSHFINEITTPKVKFDKGIILYEREDENNNYLCLVNLGKETANFELANGYKEYFGDEKINKGKLESCQYIILKGGK